MPYSGDGNYRIEFYEPLSTEDKYAYFFTIDSSGNNTSDNLNALQAISEQKKAAFYKKCDGLMEQLAAAQKDNEYAKISYTIPSVQYKDGDKSSSKMYVVKMEKSDERAVIGYIDIYAEDEYEFFKTAKDYILFVKENALDVSGRSDFSVTINPKEKAVGIFYDITVLYANGASSIFYSSESLCSAYSERFKGIDFLKDSKQDVLEETP